MKIRDESVQISGASDSRNWRVHPASFMSCSLTARLLGMHCWSLTAVCCLAPFDVLLPQRCQQAPGMCTTHLSIRKNRAVHVRAERTACYKLIRELELLDVHAGGWQSEAPLGVVMWQNCNSYYSDLPFSGVQSTKCLSVWWKIHSIHCNNRILRRKNFTICAKWCYPAFGIILISGLEGYQCCVECVKVSNRSCFKYLL